MTQSTEEMMARIARGADRLARLKARQLLRESQALHRARQVARQAQRRRETDLGLVVNLAGLRDWQPQEILGLLLHALDDTGASPTMRLGLRKRGESRWPGAGTQDSGELSADQEVSA